MKKRYRKTLSYLFVAVIFALLIIFVINNINELRNLTIKNPGYLALIIPLGIINIYCTGQVMAHVLIPLGVKLSQHEIFGLSSLNRFLNYISPGYVGLAMRAGYLKKEHRFSYAKFVSSLGAVYALTVMIGLGMGLASLFVLRSSNIDASSTTFLLIAAIIALAILVITPNNYGSKWSWLPAKLHEVIEGWHIIRKNHINLAWTLLWVGLMLLSFIFMSYFEFRLFGENITILQSTFITSLSSMNSVLSITPAGLGISEGLNVLAAEIINVSSTTALASALMRRLAILTVLIPLSLYYAPKLFGRSLSQIKKDGASE